MKLAIGLALLVAGIAMLVWGISAADSLESEVSEFFTGNPTDKSMWLMIGGIAAAICGIVLAALGATSKKGISAT